MLALLLVAAVLLDAAPSHQVDVTATWVAAKPGTGHIMVNFEPRDPDVHVNRDPAPRLRIDQAQKVLKAEDKATLGVTKALAAGVTGDAAKYLRPSEPVSFPVFLSASAPKGPQTVRTSLTYFYCSATEGWCRKATKDLDVAVEVR